MDYKDIEPGKPFFILHKDSRKQDITVWRTEHCQDGNVDLQIFFHGENFWCNPPTDTDMEYNATQEIAKYGVVYLPKDYVEGYRRTTWNEGEAYRQQIANQVLGATRQRRSNNELQQLQ